MNLINRQHIDENHAFYEECQRLCMSSKMLRNVCLYHVRQYFFKHGKLSFPTVIVKKVKQEDDTIQYEEKHVNQYVFNFAYLYQHLKTHECYRTKNHPELQFQVNTKVLKQMFIQVNREFSGWFEGIKSYKKNPEKFAGKPKIPSYSKKYFQTKFPKDAISFEKEKGKASLSMTDIVVDLPKYIDQNNICEITICPVGNAFDIITSYKVDDSVIKQIVKESKNFEFKKVKKKETHDVIVKNADFKGSNLKIAGCDIGLNNLMALALNDKQSPNLLVKGCHLKSINQYYNKKMAHKKSALPKGVYFSKSLQKLTTKRNHKIRSLCHEATKKVVDFLVTHHVNCLVVGNNQGWKKNIHIGKKNNQNFVSIPFAKIRKMLQYKCLLSGIIYLETEESYTSKCSFTDRESLRHQTTYAGRRMTRSLFKDSKGKTLNADIHGAFNIIRKVFGYDVFHDDLNFYVKKKIVKLDQYESVIKALKLQQAKNVSPVWG